MKPASEEAGKARGGGCTALPLWRRHTGTLGRPLGEGLANASSRSVGHRLRQALLHPLPGPVAVFKISSNVSSLGPAGWVEDQDVRGGSSDCSVSRTSAAPAPKSKKETARRPASRATQAKQVKGEGSAPGRGPSVEEALHLLLHLRSKQGVESDNSPEANVKIK